MFCFHFLTLNFNNTAIPFVYIELSKTLGDNRKLQVEDGIYFALEAVMRR